MWNRWTLRQSWLCLSAPFWLDQPWLLASWGSIAALRFLVPFLLAEGRRLPADFVTLTRPLLAGAALWFPASYLGWQFLCLAALTDFVDGKLARRQGQTAFGGLLDMESDAFLILAVGTFAATDSGLGMWALFPGMLRYVWVLLTSHLPTRETTRLGASRAKLLYAVGLTSLLGCALPFWLSQDLRFILGVISCLAIGGSFALDLPGLFQRLRHQRISG